MMASLAKQTLTPLTQRKATLQLLSNDWIKERNQIRREHVEFCLRHLVQHLMKHWSNLADKGLNLSQE